MEVLIGVIALGLVGWYFWPKAQKAADVNQDGKVDAADAKAAVAAVEAKVEEAVKVEAAKVIEEAKAAEAKVEEVVKAEVKKAVTKAKAAAKKAADVNQDGKVDAADVKAAVKKVATRATKPKKTKS
jgi:hypothetical protein